VDRAAPRPPAHRVLPTLAWWLFGTQLGLCVSGAAFDLMWQTPLAAMTFLFAVFFVPAVWLLNGAQLALGLVMAVPVGRGLRRATDREQLARHALVAAAYGLLGAAVLGAPAVLSAPGADDPGGALRRTLLLGAAMSWELWLPALAGWPSRPLRGWRRTPPSPPPPRGTPWP